MKNLAIALILVLTIASGCRNKEAINEQETFPILSGQYMGQDPPELIPKVFTPNIVSTGMAEINAVFSPDYKEFYYSILMPNRNFVIIQMKYDGKQWSQPEVAPFSGNYPDADPFITCDGKWLYFISKRPINETDTIKKDWDIWRVSKTPDSWSEPERLDSTINSTEDDTYPSLSANGTLYFSSGRIGTNNKDIFYAKSRENQFDTPVRLNDTINGFWEGDLYISPDEDYLIFRSFRREVGNGLFITFKQNGRWNFPQRMGKEINMTGSEGCPIVSPDGKYFFFCSANTIQTNESAEKLTYQKIKANFINSYNNPQRGNSDVYWVDSKIIENYRNNSR